MFYFSMPNIKAEFKAEFMSPIFVSFGLCWWYLTTQLHTDTTFALLRLLS